MDQYQHGMEFGQALQKIAHIEIDMEDMSDDIKKLKDDMQGLRNILTRGSILAALWISGLVGNLGAEVAGKAVGTAVAKALKLG